MRAKSLVDFYLKSKKKPAAGISSSNSCDSLPENAQLHTQMVLCLMTVEEIYLDVQRATTEAIWIGWVQVWQFLPVSRSPLIIPVKPLRPLCLCVTNKQTHTRTHAEPNGRYYTNVHQGFDCTSFGLSGSVSSRAAEGLSSHYAFCFHATSAKCTDCSPKFQSEALNAAGTQQVRECLYVLFFFCWCAVSSWWGGVVSWKVLLSDGR